MDPPSVPHATEYVLVSSSSLDSCLPVSIQVVLLSPSIVVSGDEDNSEEQDLVVEFSLSPPMVRMVLGENEEAFVD